METGAKGDMQSLRVSDWGRTMLRRLQLPGVDASGRDVGKRLGLSIELLSHGVAQPLPATYIDCGRRLFSSFTGRPLDSSDLEYRSHQLPRGFVWT